jgi:hypothetical protein
VGEAWGGAARAYLTGSDGRRYPAAVSFHIEGTPARHRVRLRADAVPLEVEPVSFTLSGLKRIDTLTIPVDLPQ